MSKCLIPLNDHVKNEKHCAMCGGQIQQKCTLLASLSWQLFGCPAKGRIWQTEGISFAKHFLKKKKRNWKK